MGKHERRAYLEAIRGRYRKAKRAGKTRIPTQEVILQTQSACRPPQGLIRPARQRPDIPDFLRYADQQSYSVAPALSRTSGLSRSNLMKPG
jgi:hypothetical protein